MGIFDKRDRAKGIKPKKLEPVVPKVPLRKGTLMERFDKAAEDRSQKEHPEAFSEMTRILSLPLSQPLSETEVEDFQRSHVLAGPYEDNWRLFDTQVEAVRAFEEMGSGFFPIGVGWGKTLITLMTAQHAWTNGTFKIMLLIPPNVYPQLMKQDLQFARSRVPITYPIHGLHKAAAERTALANSNKPGLYVYPYSLLSSKDAHKLLEAVDPDLIIADEVHYLKRRESARTKRLLHFISEREIQGRPVRGVGLSGTITTKSLMDYHHLIKWCLGNASPVPLSPVMAQGWANIVDTGSNAFGNQTGPLRPLLRWAREKFKDQESEKLDYGVTGFRHAYRLRLNSAPGVVSSGDAEIGSSLSIEAVECSTDGHKGEERLKELIKQVEDEWTTPNGDEIEHAIHTYKWMYELSSGFYNEMFWPSPERLVERREAESLAHAEELLTRAHIHHAKSQTYAKELRSWLSFNHVPGMDTPLLVASNMSKHGALYVSRDLHDAWSEMHAAKFDGMPERLKRAVRVCDFKIRAAVGWAKTFRKGVIWYHNQEMGLWLRDAMYDANIDHLFCPAGDEHNANIIDHQHKNKIVLASISAHGTGKNLQHFDHSLNVQWPRAANIAEQMLGRQHRQGQMSDEVKAMRLRGMIFDDLLFAACVGDACYIHQTTGTRQKLIYGNYSPMPPIFPDEALTERGFENRKLDREQKTLLKEKFGEFSHINSN